MLGTLENGLFALSQVLRLPVIALLWLCVAAALFMAGGCFAEFLARRRERRRFDLHRWLQAGPVLSAAPARRAELPAPLRAMLREVEEQKASDALRDGGLEHVVLQREERVRHTLAGSRILVKVGPSLGLLGTLIPMGAALASLTAGNIGAMAGQMVVAFTTTIIGLAAGTIAYIVQAVRHGWVNETVREQRFLAERIAGELERPEEVGPVLAGGRGPAPAEPSVASGGR